MRTKEYNAWSGMIFRCTQPNKSSKIKYGNTPYNGMEIEHSWLGVGGFAAFLNDIGKSPSVDYTLDRIDNQRGYVKGNVRWATIKESNTNKSNTHWITAFGLTKPIQEWADELGISSTAIRRRIDILGWTEEEAVGKPSQVNRPTNDEYYLSIAGRVAKRGTCARRFVGCVLVDKYYRVISTAYNSVASGVPNCTSVSCPGAFAKSGEALHLCQAKHAEELALIKCPDVYQIYTCYSTTAPCIHCVRRLLDTSCQRVVFAEPYPHEDAKLLWLRNNREWVEVGKE